MRHKFCIILLVLAFLTPLIIMTTICTADYTTMNLPEGAIARFGKGHANDIKFSADGKFIAAASGLGIWLYDVQTYEEVALLTGHNGGVNAIAFSPDGQMLASSGKNSTIRLWSVSTKREIATLKGHSSGVDAITFSPDGQILLSEGQGDIQQDLDTREYEIKMWSIPEKREIATFKGLPNGFVFSPNGQMLAIYDGDSTIRLWSVSKKQEIATLKGHDSGVDAVAFSPDGQILASGDMNFKGGKIKLWSVSKKQEIATLKGHDSGVNAVTFSPDGQILASGGWGNVKLWSVSKKQEVATLKGHSKGIDSLVFSPDGQILASGDGVGIIKLWSISTKREIATLDGDDPGDIDMKRFAGAASPRIIVGSIMFSLDGQILASKYSNSIIKLWSVSKKREIATFREHESLDFSPDGQLLASGGWDDVRIWSVPKKREIATLKGHRFIVYNSNGQVIARRGGSDIKVWSVPEKREIATFYHSGWIDTIIFSPDGQLLASGGWDDVKVWSVPEKREIATFYHSGWMATSVDSIMFLPNGQMLASGSGSLGGSDIKVWSVPEKREIATFKDEESFFSREFAFSPDGRTLASGNRDSTIELWSVSKKQEITTLKGHSGSVGSLAFSPDGRTLASGDRNSNIKLWSVSKKQEIAMLKGHSGSVGSLAFSPDGQTLASGDRNSNIKLWSVSKKQEIAMLKGHSGSVGSLAFSPDGQTLISGAGFGVIWLWDLSHFVSDTASTAALPPILSIEDIKFSEKVLDAGETATLSIRIKNIGSGDARNLTIQLSSNSPGLLFPSTTNVPLIPKKTGEQTVNIPIEGAAKLPTGKAKIEIYLIDPHFIQEIPGKRLTFPTRKLRTPKLVLVHPTVVEKESARPNEKIDLNEVIELTFYVQNQGVGDAKEVKVQVGNNQHGVRRLRTDETESKITNPIFPEIRSGEHQLVSNIYTYHINSEFKDRELLFKIGVTEKHPNFGFLETKKFAINKKLKPLGKITPVSIDDEAEFHESPQVEELPPLKSSGNTRWIILIVFCGIIISIIIWKRLNKGKQTTSRTTTTQSKPSKPDPRQEAAYKKAAGRKERFK